ncbi:hypothetical protein [Thiothrix subterranea]|uniref:hypothetical protein n=1 Tax=Thiothrix subterranea TaxID=2735563 RepID=UPI00280AED44|nr:hypothetical protein [Thiothrix subterranea]
MAYTEPYYHQGEHETAFPSVMTAAIPHYQAQAQEVTLFEHAFRRQLPVLLKGPRVAAKPASSNTWQPNWAGRCTRLPATTI